MLSFHTTKTSKLLILVRHAESKLNACRKDHLAKPWQLLTNGIGDVIDPGLKDAPLTLHGQKQAQQAGRKLAKDIFRGALPPIELVGVSPLRRTLHTCRILADSADHEFGHIYGQEDSKLWWPNHPESGGKRQLVILPFLREFRTTAADIPCVKPNQTLDFWSERNVDLKFAQKSDFKIDHKGSKAHVKLGHMLAIGLTKKCRKVRVEDASSIARRVEMMEAWLESRPEQVIMLVGHSMFFRSWQYWWQEHTSPQTIWALRPRLLDSEFAVQSSKRFESSTIFCGGCGDGCGVVDEFVVHHKESSDCSTGASSRTTSDSGPPPRCGFERVMLEKRSGRRAIVDCPNAEFLLVRWMR